MSFDNNSFDTNSFSVTSWLFDVVQAGWQEIIRFTAVIRRVIGFETEF